jgi:hypothetical protein
MNVNKVAIVQERKDRELRSEGVVHGPSRAVARREEGSNDYGHNMNNVPVSLLRNIDSSCLTFLGTLPDFSLLHPKHLQFSLNPHLPLGGRLAHFQDFWSQITSDNWVLSVVRSGFHLALTATPPATGVRWTQMRRNEFCSVLLEEVRELVGKAAVELVPINQQGKGFYSTYFLVPKKDGGVRPILNLKPFNRFMARQKFKMETLPGVLSVLPQGAWIASLDLKDAYFHVPIAKEYWQFLRFAVQGTHYQYRVTPFGLSLAPFLFTRVVFTIVAWLREQGIHLHAYLDDLLIVGQSPPHLEHAVLVTIQTLVRAGFTINLKKSELRPTQDLLYIGGRLRTDLGMVVLPESRAQVLSNACKSLARVGLYHSVRVWMKILGLMAATIVSVRHARLRMRPIQFFVKQGWNSSDFEQKLMTTRVVAQALLWWVNVENLTQGVPLRALIPTLVITTDASMEGWGGHLTVQGQNLLFSGLWSLRERSYHINFLELRAVWLTLVRALPHIAGQIVKVECDNTTAVSYMNKQGGTLSHTLCQEACRLHEWLIMHAIQLVAVHRPGVDNHLADFLSRNRPDPTEWSLSASMCRRLWERWGRPQIDLFASHANHKLPAWFSRTNCPGSNGPDAFNQSWTGLSVYLFPPLNLLHRSLLKLKSDRVQNAIVVAPYWPKRIWFPLLCAMAAHPPWFLPKERNLLSQTLPDKGILHHPDLSSLRLTAWKVNALIG